MTHHTDETTAQAIASRVILEQSKIAPDDAVGTVVGDGGAVVVVDARVGAEVQGVGSGVVREVKLRDVVVVVVLGHVVFDLVVVGQEEGCIVVVTGD
jgi:hypothetical protein